VRLSRSFTALVVVGLLSLLGACTADVNGTTDAGVGNTPHVAKTPALFSCRETCWNDVPYNACSDQRDSCLSQATNASDSLHCRQMARACRKERRNCLRGCNAQGNNAHVDGPKYSPVQRGTGTENSISGDATDGN
jgi:hypothetical protein